MPIARCMALLRKLRQPNTSKLMRPLKMKDLPVVINHGERAITIWVAQLKD
jgi:hypothetical protein